jgi:hypothetical protein
MVFAQSLAAAILSINRRTRLLNVKLRGRGGKFKNGRLKEISWSARQHELGRPLRSPNEALPPSRAKFEN